MAKKSMRGLNSSTDYVTAYVEHVWRVLVKCADQTKSVYPMLTYSVGGNECAAPIDRESFLEIGRTMAKNPIAIPIMMGQMGPELAVLALQMAQSEANPVSEGKDQEAEFLREVECVIRRIRPDCLVFSTPVRVVEGKSKSYVRGIVEKIKNMALGANAVAVIGRNPVRTFTLVRPFVRDLFGNFHFGEAVVRDSLAGHNQPDEYFSKIFEPNHN
jgi:hypothetical protein